MLKHIILTAGVLILGIISISAQIEYEPGHFVKEDGSRIDCLIKYADWRNNPSAIEYRLSEDGSIYTAAIDSVQEFEIKGMARYERHTVLIDQSSDDMRDLSWQYRPEFEEKTVFLNVLVSGAVSLYYYHETSMDRFFYGTDTSGLKQLVYKQYLVEQNSNRVNAMYRQQIKNNFTCESVTDKDIANLDYSMKELVRFFNAYNGCLGETALDYTQMRKQDLFNLNIRPGLNIADLEIYDAERKVTYTFNTSFTFKVGIETEFFLPFNRNKWALVVEPTYHYYSGELVDSDDFRPIREDFTTKFSTIQVPFGIRYYAFIDEKSKLFFNAQYVVDIPLTRKLEYNWTARDLKTRGTFALGAGYTFANRYSCELRYYFTKDILKDNITVYADYTQFSINFGYTLL